MANAIEVDFSLPGERIVDMLERVARERGYPDILVVDNGPELRGRALDGWADDHGVQLYFIDPGKPTQNAYIESFNGRYREECLNQHWFTSIFEAREIIEDWRIDYNNPSTRRNGRSRLSYLMAPRPRPLLTPPNDGKQMRNRLDLRVTLKNGAGQFA
jgi:transposase InsO family protein